MIGSPSDDPSPTARERRIARVAESDTVGTGSAFAIGCTLVTFLAIGLGIVIFLVLRVF